MQVAQSGHAGIEFALRYPEIARTHPTLVCLSAPDEAYLSMLWYDHLDADAAVVAFTEPDLNEAMTAVASNYRSSFIERLPLTLKGGVE